MDLLQELEQTAIESFDVCNRAMQSLESGSYKCRKFIPELTRRLKLVASGATFLLETLKTAKTAKPMVDAMPPANQWVSVKDRLPEKAGLYLLRRSVPPGGYLTVELSASIISMFIKRYYITHWMELTPPEKT